MNASMSKKLRFSDAVYAMHATPKTLRNWLSRKLVKLDSQANQDLSWTEYSFADIAILVLTKVLVDFGMEVETANVLARELLSMKCPPFLRRSDNMPAAAYYTGWATSRLLIWQENQHWNFRVDEVAPNTPRIVSEPNPSYLIIDVHTVLRVAFERAVESNKDGNQ